MEAEKDFKKQEEVLNSDLRVITRILKVLRFYAALFIIIIIAITCLGGAYGRFVAKTKYKATKSAMLITNIIATTEEGEEYSPSIRNDVYLALTYMTDVAFMVRQKNVADRATEIYHEKGGIGTIYAGSIVVDYEEDNLIFSISYTDYDESNASLKLQSIVEAAREDETIRSELKVVNYFDILPLQNDCDITVDNRILSFSLIGLGIGVILDVLIAILLVILDNTLKDPIELESITGTNFFGYIEKSEK